MYKCSVDNNDVGILWNVNGTLLPDSSITVLGVAISGMAQNSCLVIPGNPKLNNTTVRCIASGYIENVGSYINSSSATLYIQGIF